VPEWNSLKHIELIVQIEATYQVRFSRTEIASLRSMGEIRSLLSRKGVAEELGHG
jgi:acyl carrier protein